MLFSCCFELGELDADERFFEHRRTIGLEPPYEPDLVGFGVELVQPLHLHAQGISDSVVGEVPKLDSSFGAEMAIDHIAIRTRHHRNPKAELADRLTHPADCCIVLPRVSRVRDAARLRATIANAIEFKEREFELDFRIIRPSDKQLRTLRCPRCASSTTVGRGDPLRSLSN